MAEPQEIGAQEAREVLRDALPRLAEAAGTEVTGDIGDLEPLTAIQDALNLGRYEEIIISTLPLGASRWLKRDLVSRAQAFGLPRRCSRRRNPSWGVKTRGVPDSPAIAFAHAGSVTPFLRP